MFWKTASVFYPSPQPQPKSNKSIVYFLHLQSFKWFRVAFVCFHIIQVSYSLELFKFHDFPWRFLWPFQVFKDLRFSCQFQKIKNFPCFRVFLDLKQFNRHKRWCPPQCVPFALFNYSSLSYSVLALSSAVTYNYLLNKTLIFHDFRGPTIKFHDFPGLGNDILKFHDFPGFHDRYEPYYLLLKIKFSRKM